MDALSSLLSDKVIFHSPVVYTPQIGKEVTGKYLAAAFNVLVNDTFNYIREIAWEREAMLEFEVELDGIAINGVDIISWDENNQIVDFKVMIRPLKAINIIHEKMMEELQRSKKK
ncbi:MAG: nuclear transport factor 2 family protein [Gammaproteobacteria bacterium]|nr:nuclear transport factor 2 family protein [Gammaproteobacteria bacterium]